MPNDEHTIESVDPGALANLNDKERELIDKLAGGKGKYARFVLAALSSIPWFGILSAVGGFTAERSQEKVNELLKLWIQEHREKAEELAQTIQDIVARLDKLGVDVEARIQSPEYLTLVRSTFKSWDDAATQEKRRMFKKLIANAAIGSADFSPDDLIRLFIGWIDRYHEAHFMVIREIYNNPFITRGEIWDRVHPGGRPKENSLEADLFKCLINELSIGEVLRQARDTDGEGNFLKNRRTTHPKSPYMISAFEDGKPYVLTELGKQFVHYVIDDIVPLIEGTAKQPHE